MNPKPYSHRRSRRPYYIALAVAVAAGLTGTTVGLLGQGGDAQATGSTAKESPQKGATDNAADLNGDGHPDEVLPVAGKKHGYLGVVYGSKKGLAPKKHVLLSQEHLGINPGGNDMDSVSQDPHGQPAVGDLDDDGHPDIATDSGAAIAWGGKDGPSADGPVAHPELPHQGEDNTLYFSGPVVGDFNDDGHTDLATARNVLEGDSEKLVVMNGPFNRDGKAARVTELDNPLPHGIGGLSAGHANGDKATDLVAHGEHSESGDGGGSVRLLTGGAKTPTGLSSEPRKLAHGEDVVFGDFDGDKRRDIAVGNSMLSEDPDAPSYERGKLYVYYGKDPETAHRIDGGKKNGGFGLQLNPADLDGDGHDDLAVNLCKANSNCRVQVLHGSAKGLGSKVWREPKREGTLKPYNARDFNHDGEDELGIGDGINSTVGGSTHYWYTDGTKKNVAKFSSSSLGAK